LCTPWMPAAMALTTEHVTKVEADAWWIERLYRRSDAMAPTAGDSMTSSRPSREPSPASTAPSLPAAELDFWPPENPFPAHCGHNGQSTKLQLRSSWTSTSTAASAEQSSQSLSSSCGAERYRAQPFEDSFGSELLAQQRRPLGCGLGSSISPKAARGSILASSLSFSFGDDETGGLASADDGWAVIRAIIRGSAPACGLQPSCVRNYGLVGVSEHASWQRTVAQPRPPPALAPDSWSPVPSPHFTV